MREGPGALQSQFGINSESQPAQKKKHKKSKRASSRGGKQHTSSPAVIFPTVTFPAVQQRVSLEEEPPAFDSFPPAEAFFEPPEWASTFPPTLDLFPATTTLPEEMQIAATSASAPAIVKTKSPVDHVKPDSKKSSVDGERIEKNNKAASSADSDAFLNEPPSSPAVVPALQKNSADETVVLTESVGAASKLAPSVLDDVGSNLLPAGSASPFLGQDQREPSPQDAVSPSISEGSPSSPPRQPVLSKTSQQPVLSNTSQQLVLSKGLSQNADENAVLRLNGVRLSDIESTLGVDVLRELFFSSVAEACGVPRDRIKINAIRATGAEK